MVAAFSSYDVCPASLERKKVGKNKEDGINWITPLVTNNSDTWTWLCVQLSFNHEKLKYISFHLIRAHGCSTVEDHLQQVIVLPSHWHTFCITFILFGMHVLYKNAPKMQQWHIKSYYRERSSIPTCSIFYGSQSHRAFGLPSRSPAE